MTEPEPPQLHFTRDHVMAMTQLLTMLSQRLAEQRERRGRAAFSNAEHAARIADTHEHPVVRPMSEAEHRAFTAQAGDPHVLQRGLPGQDRQRPRGQSTFGRDHQSEDDHRHRRTGAA